jgi:hypothetical protein
LNWYFLNKNLILPEFVVEYEYKTSFPNKSIQQNSLSQKFFFSPFTPRVFRTATAQLSFSSTLSPFMSTARLHTGNECESKLSFSTSIFNEVGFHLPLNEHESGDILPLVFPCMTLVNNIDTLLEVNEQSPSMTLVSSNKTFKTYEEEKLKFDDAEKCDGESNSIKRRCFGTILETPFQKQLDYISSVLPSSLGKKSEELFLPYYDILKNLFASPDVCFPLNFPTLSINSSINCSQSLKNITHLFLHNCGIVDIAADTFISCQNTLTNFSLPLNNLSNSTSNFDFLKPLSKLISLDLSFNNISSIASFSGYALSHLESLNLCCNSLVYLDDFNVVSDRIKEVKILNLWNILYAVPRDIFR